MTSPFLHPSTINGAASFHSQWKKLAQAWKTTQYDDLHCCRRQQPPGNSKAYCWQSEDIDCCIDDATTVTLPHCTRSCCTSTVVAAIYAMNLRSDQSTWPQHSQYFHWTLQLMTTCHQTRYDCKESWVEKMQSYFHYKPLLWPWRCHPHFLRDTLAHDDAPPHHV